MPDPEWKSRFAAELQASGRSLRDVSLAAGKGPGYVHSLLGAEGKDPTVGNFLDICSAANISPYKVLGGFEITRETEQLLSLLERADDELKRSVLVLLRRGRRDEEIQAPPPVAQDRQRAKRQ